MMTVKALGGVVLRQSRGLGHCVEPSVLGCVNQVLMLTTYQPVGRSRPWAASCCDSRADPATVFDADPGRGVIDN